MNVSLRSFWQGHFSGITFWPMFIEFAYPAGESVARDPLGAFPQEFAPEVTGEACCCTNLFFIKLSPCRAGCLPKPYSLCSITHVEV